MRFEAAENIHEIACGGGGGGGGAMGFRRGVERGGGWGAGTFRLV